MRALFTAKTGLEAQQLKIDNISHNLANANTDGFKKSRLTFEDLIYQNIRTTGAPINGEQNTPTGLQVGVGVKAGATVKSFSQGSLLQTDEPLNLAINGRGFFQIQLPNGEIGYTRDGNFSLNQDGVLVNLQGIPLVGDIEIPAEAQKITITREGQINAILPGETEFTNLGELQLADFVNPAGLESIGGNLFKQTPSSGEPIVLEPGDEQIGVINQGFIEGSNVNIVESMVNMIQSQRVYEMNSKAVSTVDQMMGRLTQL